jgi:RHS repeat-associated protein
MGVTRYAYDPAGNRETVTLPNGITTHTTYDARNLTTDVVSRTVDGTVLDAWHYTLDEAGMRRAVADAIGRRVDYTYDDLDRLTEERITESNGEIRVFQHTYDAVGNRITRTDDGMTTQCSYDANDRLLFAGNDAYTYDENGNTIEAIVGGQITTYNYDQMNRLIEAVTPGHTLAYHYDADGIRVGKAVDGTWTEYLVDHNRPYPQVLAESRQGTPTVTYTYGNDLLSQHRTSGTSYYLTDAHGNKAALTDETGLVTDTYRYEAYGDILDRTGTTGTTPNAYTYTGEQYDADLGMTYLRARYYNGHLGRFQTMDTWLGRQDHPITQNKYLYGNANPVMGFDPSGKSTLVALSTSQSIGLGLAAITAYTLIHPFSREALVRSTVYLLNHLRKLEYLILAANTKPIYGLIEDARRELEAINSTTPHGSQDPRNHKRKEIKAFLDRALRLAKKRLKGKKRERIVKEIRDIAEKAGVQLSG